MNKKEICENNKTFGYYSGFGGIELKEFDYSINDSVYFVANAWYGKKSYHKARIYIGTNDHAYFIFKGVKISLDECIKV